MTITWKRVMNGEFHAEVDGQATQYRVFNGCLGLSGHGKNLYIPAVGETPMTKPGWGTTLRQAKQMVEMKIKKERA